MSKKQTPLFDSTIQTREIKKHSSLVQMGNITTLRERKTLNALIYIAKDQLKRQPEERRFTCDLWQIKRLTGRDDSNTVELKQALSNLVDTKIEYNILNKDKEVRSVFAVLAEARIEVQGSGKPTTVTFEFPSTVLWAIKHPSIYVKLNLLMLRGFTSKHSLALYEFLADYLNLHAFRCEANDFRRLMGIEESQYPSFTMLRKRVLDVAVNEINDKSDIVVSYELERSGRKITAILFEMDRKQESLEEHGAESAIRDKLKFFWLKDTVIDTLLENHDESYLRVNIAVVEEQYKRGKIKNVAGYLMKAFADDYSQQKTDLTALNEEEKRQVIEAEKDAENEKKQFEQDKRKAVKSYLNDLDTEDKTHLREEFFADSEENPRLQKLSEKNEFSHPAIQAMYFKWVAKNKLSKKRHTFEDFQALSVVEESTGTA